jgi:serine protease DegQ
MMETQTVTQTEASGLLGSLSEGIANAVASVAPGVVRVDDGTRLTATGIIWSPDGVIVTTSHGVERDNSLAIELADGSRHAATLIGRDHDSDIAVLRVNVVGLPAIQTAPQNEVRVGHIVTAIGRPGNYGLQATMGIVSAKIDSQSGGQDEYILYTDATLYPGFSGGPLVDTSGRVLGMTNRMFGRGMGVALGTPIIVRIANALLTHGRVRRGYLGIGTQPVLLQAALRQTLSLSQERALLIVQVGADSPAEQGGLMIGDVLLQINHQAIQDVDELRRHLQAEQSVPVQIIRGGQLQELQIKVGTEA